MFDSLCVEELLHRFEALLGQGHLVELFLADDGEGDDRAFGPLRPGRVGVFDAQNERAAVLFRIGPAEERGARTADMQIAGGTGGEAGADHGRCLNSSTVLSTR